MASFPGHRLPRELLSSIYEESCIERHSCIFDEFMPRWKLCPHIWSSKGPQVEGQGLDSFIKCDVYIRGETADDIGFYQPRVEHFCIPYEGLQLQRNVIKALGHELSNASPYICQRILHSFGASNEQNVVRSNTEYFGNGSKIYHWLLIHYYQAPALTPPNTTMRLPVDPSLIPQRWHQKPPVLIPPRFTDVDRRKEIWKLMRALALNCPATDDDLRGKEAFSAVWGQSLPVEIYVDLERERRVLPMLRWEEMGDLRAVFIDLRCTGDTGLITQEDVEKMAAKMCKHLRLDILGLAGASRGNDSVLRGQANVTARALEKDQEHSLVKLFRGALKPGGMLIMWDLPSTLSQPIQTSPPLFVVPSATFPSQRDEEYGQYLNR